MGADFIFALTRKPSDISVTRQKISELTLDDCLRLADEVMGWNIDHPEGLEFLAADVRTRLHEALTALSESQPRSVGIMTIKGEQYWITGGMSWGDSPTDTFDDIMFLDHSGVCDD